MSQKMKCKVCGYVYDPEKGESRRNVEPGTEWEDVPNRFTCPSCGAPKKSFISID
ncbi:rubredoxin [Methanobrevibacter filiformis]|nr:rubredoxin [Methanobrevibacter filiformis]